MGGGTAAGLTAAICSEQRRERVTVTLGIQTGETQTDRGDECVILMNPGEKRGKNV